MRGGGCDDGVGIVSVLVVVVVVVAVYLFGTSYNICLNVRVHRIQLLNLLKLGQTFMVHLHIQRETDVVHATLSVYEKGMSI